VTASEHRLPMPADQSRRSFIGHRFKLFDGFVDGVAFIKPGNRLAQGFGIIGVGQKIGGFVHRIVILKRDHHDRAALGAGDYQRLVVVIDAIHHRGKIGTQFGGGGVFHGWYVRD